MSPWAGRRLLRALIPKPLALRLRREWLARRMVQGRAHIEREVELLPQIVSRDAVCWDIGANVGMYTLALAKLAARVIAFEPIPHSLETLQEVIRLAGVANVETHRLAISDTAGTARMHVPAEGFYGGFYLATLDDQGEVSVRTESVDGLIASGYPEPVFIKCDVEGAERRVINGARELIARRHPTWLLETFEPDVIRLMESLGYAAHVRGPANTLQRVSELRESDRNYIFL